MNRQLSIFLILSIIFLVCASIIYLFMRFFLSMLHPGSEMMAFADYHEEISHVR